MIELTPADLPDALASMDSGELLPCPFCGARAERIDIEDGENAGGSCIACTQCQASSNVEFEFKENFVNNWNRRAQLSAPEAGAVTVDETVRSFIRTRIKDYGDDGWLCDECHCDYATTLDAVPHTKSCWVARFQMALTPVLTGGGT